MSRVHDVQPEEAGCGGWWTPEGWWRCGGQPPPPSTNLDRPPLSSFSEDSPEIPRHIERDGEPMRGGTEPHIDAEHTEPLEPESHGRPRAGRGRPWRARDRSTGGADGDEGREREGARRSRVRADPERDERDGDAPLEMHQRHAGPAPSPEVVAQQSPTPAQHERAVRRKVGAGDATLRANQEPRAARGHQNMAGTPEPQVRRASVEPARLDGALEMQVAPHGEPLAPPLERQLHQVDAGAAERGVRSEGAVRGRRDDGEGPDRLSTGGRAPLPADPHAVAIGHAGAFGFVVVTIVAPEFLRRERVHERRDDG